MGPGHSVMIASPLKLRGPAHRAHAHPRIVAGQRVSRASARPGPPAARMLLGRPNSSTADYGLAIRSLRSPGTLRGVR